MRRPFFLVLPSVLCACTLHSTVSQWHERVGPDGKPVYMKSATNVAINLGILVPFLGRTSMGEMVDVTTKDIAEEGGDRVRVVESSSENYWYGFPPLTWILTPVVTELRIEYEPTAEQIQRDREQRAREEAERQARRDREQGPGFVP